MTHKISVSGLALVRLQVTSTNGGAGHAGVDRIVGATTVDQ